MAFTFDKTFDLRPADRDGPKGIDIERVFDFDLDAELVIDSAVTLDIPDDFVFAPAATSGGGSASGSGSAGASFYGFASGSGSSSVSASVSSGVGADGRSFSSGSFSLEGDSGSGSLDLFAGPDAFSLDLFL